VIAGFYCEADDICALLWYYFLTDVTGQPVGPMLNGQEVQEASFTASLLHYE